MKTMLICHKGSGLNPLILPRWLQSFSELKGVIVIEEQKRIRIRIKNEIKRIGILRFIDIVLFRTYYRLFKAKSDIAWEKATIMTLKKKYPQIKDDTPILITNSPNSEESYKFIERQKPDIVLARCKFLIKERIFSLPQIGIFVLHPGICPEYRNAHGCFWALANNDIKNVGMTLLKIDKGIDTGPIYSYFRINPKYFHESHIRVQLRTVFDNLDEIKEKLIKIYNNDINVLDVKGRKSNIWGQPWLSKYIKIKFNKYGYS
tara:strand:+ start:444 stop:1226 length:783 start_codon:yes stop_codon:yes gene_type:complete